MENLKFASLSVIAIVFIFEPNLVFSNDGDMFVKKCMAEIDEKYKIIQEGIKNARDDSSLVHFRNEEKKFRKWAYDSSMKYSWRPIQNKKLKRYFEIYVRESFHLLSDEIAYNFSSTVENVNKVSAEALSLFQGTIMDNLRTKSHSQSKYKFLDKKKNIDTTQEQWEKCSHDLARNVQPLIKNYFDMIDTAAKSRNLQSNTSEFWFSMMNYGKDFSRSELESLWGDKIKEPAHHLFSYLRTELANTFKSLRPYKDGPMPAYLYGIISHPKSYSKAFQKENLEIVASNQLQNTPDFNVKKLVKTAETFFISLTFPPLGDNFWEQSKLNWLHDNEIHTEDRYINKNIYWLEANAPINIETYNKIHRHLFKIYRNLIMEENNLEWIFREPDFKPFLDALESALAMSTKTAARMINDRILTREAVSEELTIELLKSEAANVFTELASSQIMESWSWDILEKRINENDIYTELWNRRLLIEGVIPIGENNSSADISSLLDCSSQDHMFPFQSNYLNFTTVILQYQIFAGLCKIAGRYDPDHPDSHPLHQCDLLGRTSAGKLLRDIILPLGSSAHWKDQLEMITGTRKLNANALLDYFSPLFKHIESAQAKISDRPGCKDKILKCFRKRE